MKDRLTSFLGISPEELTQPTILKQKDNVFYLLLNTKANAFTRQLIRNIHRQLDLVEKHQGPTCLVTASLSKLFSGGVDLKILSNEESQDQKFTVLETTNLLGRIAILPVPTIAMVSGGAAGGGCIFAFAHDYIYASDNAKFSVKQAELQVFFPPGLLSIVRKRQSYPHIYRDMAIFSREFQAQEALKVDLIDGVNSQDTLLGIVHAKGSKLAKYGENKINLRKVKGELYRDVITNCFELQTAPSTLAFFKYPAFPKL